MRGVLEVALYYIYKACRELSGLWFSATITSDRHTMADILVKEKSEDTKGVIRSRKSTDRQYSD
jgi:hypothetical protein